MKKLFSLAIALILLTAFVTPMPSALNDATAEASKYKYQQYAGMTPEEIVATLTLPQKAAQMVQPILYRASIRPMRNNCYGSIYGDEGALDAAAWRKQVDMYQQAAIESDAGIPFILAQDDVHGVGYCLNAVYFPQNIGIGAADDEALTYQMGLITADEARQCHMLWNLYPCIAQSNDPRWGRNYECYSSDLDTIKRLGTAYTKGLIDGGVIACAKHYFGDGNVLYGTGEQSDYARLIDRGNAVLSQEEIDALLDVYQAQIDAGVQTIMVSYSSLNGLKMHENGEYIWKLKNEMGFEGFVVSDSMAIRNTSPDSYEDQVISAVNCGIDMLMEGERFDEAMNIIINAVQDGRITQDRVDDAVVRIIRVKKNAGIFDDPLCENLETVQQKTGVPEYRAVAEALVEKSLVLLKNDNDILPLPEGTKVYITGPASDNGPAQCGGWTLGWNGSRSKDIFGVTTIKKAFSKYAENYGIEVITDPELADSADVVILCVGEKAYAEWHGDTEDLALCGMCGLEGNREAIDEAAALGKPTIACIIAGRQVLLDEDDLENWDSVVMCYLPGSEGKGISDVLCGFSGFSGRLPEPWYESVEQIGTGECRFERGFGLSYPEGFVPRTDMTVVSEAEPEPEPLTELIDFASIAEGTNYTKGYFADGVYENEYADIHINVPRDLFPVSDASILSRVQSMASEATSVDGKNYYHSVIWDSVFEGQNAILAIKIVNTHLAFPDNSQCSEDEYLDYCKASDMKDYASAGIEYESRETRTIAGHDYVREMWKMGGQGEAIVVNYYARRLDDDLILIIEAQCRGALVETPDFCEAWFE